MRCLFVNILLLLNLAIGVAFITVPSPQTKYNGKTILHARYSNEDENNKIGFTKYFPVFEKVLTTATGLLLTTAIPFVNIDPSNAADLKSQLSEFKTEIKEIEKTSNIRENNLPREAADVSTPETQPAPATPTPKKKNVLTAKQAPPPVQKQTNTKQKTATTNNKPKPATKSPEQIAAEKAAAEKAKAELQEQLAKEKAENAERDSLMAKINANRDPKYRIYSSTPENVLTTPRGENIKLPATRTRTAKKAPQSVPSLPEEKRLFDTIQKREEAMETRSAANQELQVAKKNLANLNKEDREVRRRLSRDTEKIEKLKANIAKAQKTNIDTTVLETDLGETMTSKKSSDKRLKDLTAELKATQRTINDKTKLVAKETTLIDSLNKNEKKQRAMVSTKKANLVKKEVRERTAAAKREAEQKRVATKKANEKRVKDEKARKLAAKKEAETRKLAKEKAAKESKIAYTKMKDTEKALKDRKIYFERASKSYGDNVKYADINKKAIEKNKNDIENYEKMLQDYKRVYEQTKMKESQVGK